MAEFRVVWEIDVEAEDTITAAVKALDMQQDPNSTATVFTVIDKDTQRAVEVDLIPDV